VLKMPASVRVKSPVLPPKLQDPTACSGLIWHLTRGSTPLRVVLTRSKI
jgi:hypothetical protein